MAYVWNANKTVFNVWALPNAKIAKITFILTLLETVNLARLPIVLFVILPTVSVAMMVFRDHHVLKFVLKTVLFATQDFVLSANPTSTWQTVSASPIIYSVKLDHRMVNAISALVSYRTYQILWGAFHIIQFMMKIDSFTWLQSTIWDSFGVYCHSKLITTMTQNLWFSVNHRLQ